jgi:hypothetical protein
MVKYESDVKYHAKQIKCVVMRKDVVYLGMIRWNDSISLNTGDEGYNNGKKVWEKRVQYVVLTSPPAQGVACPQATHSESESGYLLISCKPLKL